MPDLLLTREERIRFAEYCMREGSTLMGLTEQMKKINVPEIAIASKKAKALAYITVAKDLASIEEM